VNPQGKAGPLSVAGFRVGPGAYPTGIGDAIVNGRTIGKSFVSLSTILTGTNAFFSEGTATDYVGTIPLGTGAVAADYFCLRPDTGQPAGSKCISAWPTGGSSTAITGNLGEMVAIGNAGTAIAKSSAYLGSEGMNIVGTTPDYPNYRLKVGGPTQIDLTTYPVSGGSGWGDNALTFLQPTAGIRRNTTFKTNGQRFEFKGVSDVGNNPRNADIVAYDYIAAHLAGNANQVICVDATGKFIICAPQPGGGTSLTGATNQTIRFSATNTPTANSTMTNDGTRVGIGSGMADAYNRLSVNNGGLHINRSGTDMLFLNNTAGGATNVSVITNTPDVTFWNFNASTRANVNVQDLNATGNIIATDASQGVIRGRVLVSNQYATIGSYLVAGSGVATGMQTGDIAAGNDLFSARLANATNKAVCADTFGRLILCTVSSGTNVATFDGGNTPSGTASWTVPAGVNSIRVQVWGHGGGGGSGQNSVNGGGGGGAGGYVDATITVTPGQVYPITVGLGGGGATCINSGAQPSGPGSNGADSKFGTTYIARGGNGAPGQSGGTGGTYSIPSGSGINGGAGFAGTGGITGTPGSGGASGSGTTYGYGGRGGSNAPTCAGLPGGQGAVVITY
jgi:hypothetical protein